MQTGNAGMPCSGLRLLWGGFPVPRRPEAHIGLELPLDMMAALARARYVDVFNSKVFVKGFSTMLVPTKRVEDVVIWHLLYKTDPNERISYLDCPVKQLDVSMASLEDARHVVGWCSEAVCNIGGFMLSFILVKFHTVSDTSCALGISTASYSVRNSALPRSYAGCALENVEVQAGQAITGTASFSIGNREKPVPHFPVRLPEQDAVDIFQAHRLLGRGGQEGLAGQRSQRPAPSPPSLAPPQQTQV